VKFKERKERDVKEDEGKEDKTKNEECGKERKRARDVKVMEEKGRKSGKE
jgi:hypothetical protein